MVHELGKSRSVLNTFLSEIRDLEVQKDRMRFRRNMERIGEVMAYEMSRTFSYRSSEVITPLGTAEVHVLRHQPVVCTILRAGLPFQQGFLSYFDQSDAAFAAAYRRHHKGGDFEIEVDYVSTPNLEDKELIIADPMLATGSSIELVYRHLLRKGTPHRLHIASVIASEYGLNQLRSKLPENTQYWVGAIDKELTAQAYIVPGLGDAGDLAFGRKD
jgi:uracil phosphoribosyltransferase